MKSYCALGLLVFLTVHCYGFEPDDDFKVELSKVRDLSDFCKYFSEEDCSKMMNESLAPVPGQSGDKVAVSGVFGELAMFDACNPREMTIAVPRHPDPDITVWPTCTRAKRCGGCCTSEVFSCEPTETRNKIMTVFNTRLPYPGAHRFTFLGTRHVNIEEHVRCDAQCKIKPHQCHKYQLYEARKCRCVCRPERMSLKGTCSDAQIWDDSECDCICPNRNTVTCPEPSYFSTTTCKCTLKTGVTGEIDLDKLFEQIDSGLIGRDIILNNGANEPGSDVDEMEKELDQNAEKETKTENAETTTNSETTPVTSTSTESTVSTTPTTTTTTTTKPAEDPCAHMTCFGSWKPMLLKNGKCACRPPFIFQG